jgi:hypothetical protein
MEAKLLKRIDMEAALLKRLRLERERDMIIEFMCQDSSPEPELVELVQKKRKATCSPEVVDLSHETSDEEGGFIRPPLKVPECNPPRHEVVDLSHSPGDSVSSSAFAVSSASASSALGLSSASASASALGLSSVSASASSVLTFSKASASSSGSASVTSSYRPSPLSLSLPSFDEGDYKAEEGKPDDPIVCKCLRKNKSGEGLKYLRVKNGLQYGSFQKESERGKCRTYIKCTKKKSNVSYY